MGEGEKEIEDKAVEEVDDKSKEKISCIRILHLVSLSYSCAKNYCMMRLIAQDNASFRFLMDVNHIQCSKKKQLTFIIQA